MVGVFDRRFAILAQIGLILERHDKIYCPLLISRLGLLLRAGGGLFKVRNQGVHQGWIQILGAFLSCAFI